MTTVKDICKSLAIGIVGSYDDVNNEIDKLMTYLSREDPGLIAQYGATHGNSLNLKLPDGSYPIHIISRFKTTASATLKTLYERGVNCDVNAQDSLGRTPLHIACQLIKKDLVESLLGTQGINPNIVDQNGDTPLHISIRMKASDIAEELIKHEKTNPNIVNNQGRLPDQLDEAELLTGIIEKLMEKRVQKAGGSLGVLEITLQWENGNDLDLHCICPCKCEIYYTHKQCDNCLGMLDVDMNAGKIMNRVCPVEHTFWKNNPPKGTYYVYVNHYAQHDTMDASRFFVMIKHNDKIIYPRTEGNVTHSIGKVNITQFTI